MQIKISPMGVYQTNCYIVTVDGKDFIIDPGMGASEWVMENVSNPVAILNTHGHFDHVWCNAELQKKLNIPLYTPKQDSFMLLKSSLMPDLPSSIPDVEVDDSQKLNIAGVDVTFTHFPGHTPGCSVIEIGDVIFSGDFIFQHSIGRCDLPYSDPEKMKKSLLRFMKIEDDKELYPGHGNKTTIFKEKPNLRMWIQGL
jgi:glyoxylase-like metal-dependent hydrolase (beta-lactamase superfamily II)